MPLPSGKVNPYELTEIVFPYLEIEDDRVLVGPDVGCDASVIGCGDRVLVLSSDPITGAIGDPGWLSVHVNANDVATTGAEPKWFLINLFLPDGVERSRLRDIMERANDACGELDVSIVGGHTEVTPGLKRILISGAMAGEAPADRWVSAAQAEPGDRILLTKTAAIEGTFILATDREDELEREYGAELVERAKDFRKKLSVVHDALTAIKTDVVHAMHDPTEGGLAGGLYELADASQVGFSIDTERIPIADETRKICEYFELDPMKTIGSGSLVICVRPEEAEKVIGSLEGEGIKVSDIGKIAKNKEKREIDGKSLSYPEKDELWRIFEG